MNLFLLNFEESSDSKNEKIHIIENLFIGPKMTKKNNGSEAEQPISKEIA